MGKAKANNDSTAGSSADVLDCGVFHELRDSLAARPGDLATVYCQFVANASSFIAALRSADGAARARTLHNLKGSAAMFGAGRIATLAMHLQDQFPNSPAQAAYAIDELEGELAAFRRVIAANLAALRYASSHKH